MATIMAHRRLDHPFIVKSSQPVNREFHQSSFYFQTGAAIDAQLLCVNVVFNYNIVYIIIIIPKRNEG